MDFEALQEVIVAKINALAAEKKFEAFETALPPGFDKQYENLSPTPYILYEFGGKDSAGDYITITGTRDSLKWSSIAFEAVAPDPASRRRLGNVIRKAFTGYSPGVEWGELVERHSAKYKIDQPFNAEFWPPRFAEFIAFVVDVDA